MAVLQYKKVIGDEPYKQYVCGFGFHHDRYGVKTILLHEAKEIERTL
jgi:hypothetical protein